MKNAKERKQNSLSALLQKREKVSATIQSLRQKFGLGENKEVFKKQPEEEIEEIEIFEEDFLMDENQEMNEIPSDLAQSMFRNQNHQLLKLEEQISEMQEEIVGLEEAFEKNKSELEVSPKSLPEGQHYEEKENYSENKEETEEFGDFDEQSEFSETHFLECKKKKEAFLFVENKVRSLTEKLEQKFGKDSLESLACLVEQH